MQARSNSAGGEIGGWMDSEVDCRIRSDLNLIQECDDCSKSVELDGKL